ncbi:GNAT family N-acetyltransferase [Fontibacillus sp. BL9]|uniref:GNAT family N-acetyltransferase n=1 Tax=Fontibacillus sp. BL9 TaxID=3389971 RepID=UPI00397C4D3E
MSIVFDDSKKDLPSDQLHELFMLVGWSDGRETSEMLKYFNLPFKNSTLVISAWSNDRLIGVVRVLSDKIVRSIIYDLAIDPEFQDQGIGRELIKRCVEHFPNSEWLVQTTDRISGYYEKIGFKRQGNVFLSIPSKWFE